MTEQDEEQPAADSGVKQVGALEATPPETRPSRQAAKAGQKTELAQGAGTNDGARLIMIVATVVAVLGLIGTVVFASLYFSAPSGPTTTQNPAVISAAKTFLTDFFNFNAKTVDADFSAVTNMATGSFAGQASQFFNSSIRKQLETALAESRGTTREIFVQTQSATTASIYAVVDQVYVNNKITTPQSDVVRLTLNMQQVHGTWKISNVTVLEGATPAAAGSASGSAGSSVPGQ